MVLVVLAAVAFMAQLDLFIVKVAMPAIRQAFADAGERRRCGPRHEQTLARFWFGH
jgi:hypothetical protein